MSHRTDDPTSNPYAGFKVNKKKTGHRSQREDYDENQYQVMRQMSGISIHEPQPSPPRQSVNIDVAQRMGLTYEQALRTYVDENGELRYVSRIYRNIATLQKRFVLTCFLHFSLSILMRV